VRWLGTVGLFRIVLVSLPWSERLVAWVLPLLLLWPAWLWRSVLSLFWQPAPRLSKSCW
jgi:hypothetical protein